jgi:hypothetical protein
MKKRNEITRRELLKGAALSATALAAGVIIGPGIGPDKKDSADSSGPVSKVGVHVVIGPRNGFGSFVTQCTAAGRPLAVVKGVDDFGAAYDAKLRSSQTLTIGHVNAAGNHDMQAWEPINYSSAADAASQYYNLIRPIWNLNPWIDIWETFNEFSARWEWQADFYMTLMDLAEAAGYRLGLYAASVGNLPESAFPAFVRACQRAKAHGGHILTLHEYGGILDADPPSGTLRGSGLALRYRYLYETLRATNADCPLVISECGQNGGGGFVSIGPFVADFAWYDAELMRDDYVLGCAAWTLGNWGGASFQTALPALANYIITAPQRKWYTFLPMMSQ